jgi:hypothetical protein
MSGRRATCCSAPTGFLQLPSERLAVRRRDEVDDEVVCVSVHPVLHAVEQCAHAPSSWSNGRQSSRVTFRSLPEVAAEVLDALVARCKGWHKPLMTRTALQLVVEVQKLVFEGAVRLALPAAPEQLALEVTLFTPEGGFAIGVATDRAASAANDRSPSALT